MDYLSLPAVVKDQNHFFSQNVAVFFKHSQSAVL